MNFSKYERYRESGVEWLDDLPEHWKVSRLGYEAWVRARLGWKGLKAEEYVDEGYAFLATPNIKGKAIDFTNVNFINQFRYEESPEIKLRLGDILLAKDGSTLGIVNVVRNLPVPATVNSSIAVITPNANLHSVYAYYLFQSSYMEHTIQRIKGGMGVPHLFQEDLNKFYIPLPTLTEQSSIAAFLDGETTKIDALVEEQKRLIELLEEKRRGIISEVITRGADADAPMKESGVEWIGKVPAHWELTRIKFVVSMISKGTTPTTVGGDFVESGIRFLKAENIAADRVWDEPQFYITDEIHGALSRSALRENDVLVVIAGATTGKSAVLTASLAPANTNQAVAFLRCSDTVKANYLQLWLASDAVQTFIVQQAVQSAQPNLSMEDLGNIPMPLPPARERQEILRAAKSRLDPLTELVDEARTAAGLLQERRAALISAAVTGRVDVRQQAQERLAAE